MTEIRALITSATLELALMEKTIADQAARIAELNAKLAEVEARVKELKLVINEASDPDFIFGAMDNVHDMDTGLMDYAKAASRAIRAMKGGNA
jgi:chromosome segregation ATPase